MGVSMYESDYQNHQSRWSRAPDFVASPNGFISPIQDGAIRNSDAWGGGMHFTGGSGGKGMHEWVSSTRVMDETRNHSARTIYENSGGKKVNPFTGHTVSNSHPFAHFYHSEKYGKSGKL